MMVCKWDQLHSQLQLAWMRDEVEGKLAFFLITFRVPLFLTSPDLWAMFDGGSSLHIHTRSHSNPPVCSIAVSRSKNVPMFGPPIPATALFSKSSAFTKFLLTKIINAEQAAHRWEEQLVMNYKWLMINLVPGQTSLSPWPLAPDRSTSRISPQTTQLRQTSTLDPNLVRSTEDLLYRKITRESVASRTHSGFWQH